MRELIEKALGLLHQGQPMAAMKTLNEALAAGTKSCGCGCAKQLPLPFPGQAEIPRFWLNGDDLSIDDLSWDIPEGVAQSIKAEASEMCAQEDAVPDDVKAVVKTALESAVSAGLVRRVV